MILLETVQTRASNGDPQIELPWSSSQSNRNGQVLNLNCSCSRSVFKGYCAHDHSVHSFWETKKTCPKHVKAQLPLKQKGKKKERTRLRCLHARHGGLFRCQEVCVMVMGQMREEGWRRPLCFEDSPTPPRPVQPHPKTKEQTRSKLCFCMHLFWSLMFFNSLQVQQSDSTVALHGGKWTN